MSKQQTILDNEYEWNRAYIAKHGPIVCKIDLKQGMELDANDIDLRSPIGLN